MIIDTDVLKLAADWCINLSAGWFGAAFIVPATQQQPIFMSQRVAIENIILSVAFFGAAYILDNI